LHTARVGVIGTDRIGNPMAHNLLRAGYAVHVQDVRQAAYAGLLAAGAYWLALYHKDIHYALLEGHRQNS
jgi:3-hydroxyisobutyrate dehydrogenase-like beta-hydroxyacid dehydrogenase